MRVGDKIKMTTLTHGEAVFDRKGKGVHMSPSQDTYIGVIQYIGPECQFPSCEVVRCSGGNVELGLNNGFQFYTKDIGEIQSIEVLK